MKSEEAWTFLRLIFNGGRLKRIVDRNIYRTPASFKGFKDFIFLE